MIDIIQEAYSIYRKYYDSDNLEEFERPGFVKYNKPIFIGSLLDEEHYVANYLLHKLTGRPLVFTREIDPTINIVFHYPPAVIVSTPAIEEAIIINNKLKSLGYRLYFPYVYYPDHEKITITDGLIYRPNLFIPLVKFLSKVLRKTELKTRPCKICGFPTSNYSQICIGCMLRIKKENLEMFRDTLDPKYLESSRHDVKLSIEKFASILFNLRHLKRISKNIFECDICKSTKHFVKSYNLTWFFVCNNCFSKYNIPLIELDLLNKIIRLSDLQDQSVLRCYKRRWTKCVE